MTVHIYEHLHIKHINKDTIRLTKPNCTGFLLRQPSIKVSLADMSFCTGPGPSSQWTDKDRRVIVRGPPLQDSVHFHYYGN